MSTLETVKSPVTRHVSQTEEIVPFRTFLFLYSVGPCVQVHTCYDSVQGITDSLFTYSSIISGGIGDREGIMSFGRPIDENKRSLVLFISFSQLLYSKHLGLIEVHEVETGPLSLHPPLQISFNGLNWSIVTLPNFLLLRSGNLQFPITHLHIRRRV